MRFLLTTVAVGLAGAALLAESAAGVRWTAPAGWKAEPARPMRAATYAVPPAAGDTMPGECGVFFFGPGQGGSIEANLERWSSQFVGADGKTAPAKVGKRTISGLTVTTIESAGRYTGMGGPMATTTRGVPGYRLLGAIVQGPGGNVFVKFTGPANTVAAHQAKFEQLLTSFQRER
jgi:hypothetical protein